MPRFRTTAAIKSYAFWGILCCIAVIMGSISALTHSPHALISFDEGFHGAAALAFDQGLRQSFHLAGFIISPEVITTELRNGVIWYPPLWSWAAGIFSLLFGPSIAVYRAVTTIFYVMTLFGTAWFVQRSVGSRLAALVSMLVLGTVPIVVIYSHLMMLEVPLLFGVTALVGGIYLWVENRIPRTWYGWVGIIAVCALAPLTKLAAIGVAWSVLGVYAGISSLLFWRKKTYQTWLRPELLLFMLISLVPLGIYIATTQAHYGVNMLIFHVQQSEGIGVQSVNPLIRIGKTLWDYQGRYLQDALHMPILATLWVISLATYALWKRTKFAVLLVVWTIVTYLSFTAVQPQQVQYSIPIYAPLAIATGCLFAELVQYFPSSRSRFTISVLCLALLLLGQITSIPLSETYGWRVNDTGQYGVAEILTKKVQPGDRIISWHDGNTFDTRVLGLANQVQITGGSNVSCEASLLKSFEWAGVIGGGPLPTSRMMTILGAAPWERVGTYGSKLEGALYHNPTSHFPTVLYPEDLRSDLVSGDTLVINGDAKAPQLSGCPRLLPYGKLVITYTLKGLSVPDSLPDSAPALIADYASVDGKEQGSVAQTIGDLRSHLGSSMDIHFTVTHTTPNLRGDLRIWLQQRSEEIQVQQVTLRYAKATE